MSSLWEYLFKVEMYYSFVDMIVMSSNKVYVETNPEGIKNIGKGSQSTLSKLWLGDQPSQELFSGRVESIFSGKIIPDQ